MVNLKKIFIPLFLFLTINPVYSMDQKEEIENELRDIPNFSRFQVNAWLDSYEVQISLEDISELRNFCFHFDQKEYYPFGRLVVEGAIGNEGAIILASMLETDKGLRSLDLSGCN